MSEAGTPSVAFIAVGSNIKPEENIVAALKALKRAVRVSASSTFYRTEPLGARAQPTFINGVWQIETALSPAQVRNDALKPIESRLGRLHTGDKFAPRTIDLDLVLYDALVVDEIGLTLPHPDIKRPFVCGPVFELLTDPSSQIEPRLRTAIEVLLPTDRQNRTPGDPLEDFTRELRGLLD